MFRVWENFGRDESVNVIINPNKTIICAAIEKQPFTNSCNFPIIDRIIISELSPFRKFQFFRKFFSKLSQRRMPLYSYIISSAELVKEFNNRFSKPCAETLRGNQILPILPTIVRSWKARIHFSDG